MSNSNIRKENTFLREMIREKDELISLLYNRNGDIIEFVDRLQLQLDKTKEDTKKAPETPMWVTLLTALLLLEVGFMLGLFYVVMNED